MENSNPTEPTEVSRVAVRLPQFLPDRLDIWFTLAESQFSLAGVTDERTKFCHVLSQLGQRFVNEVADVITAPSQHHYYTRLEEELIERFSPSQEQRT
jgi:hypothetical protein